MLLVRLYEERGDMSGFDKFTRSRWAFYWHGEWVEFWHKSHGEKLADNHWKMMRIIQKIAMPTSVKKSEQNFFNDLKEAFEVYRIIGVGEEGEEYLFELTLSKLRMASLQQSHGETISSPVHSGGHICLILRIW